MVRWAVDQVSPIADLPICLMSNSVRLSAFTQRIWEREQVFNGDKGGAGLGRAPVVEHGDLLHAGYGAMRCAALLGVIFVLKMFARVLGQRDGGKAALLRAIVHQAVFANVEVSAAGAASPVVGNAV